MKIKTIVAVSLLAAGLGAGLFFAASYKDEASAAKSIKKITDGVYSMEYEGDYCFDQYLASGGSENTEGLVNFISDSLKKGKWSAPRVKNLPELKISLGDFGCSSISAKNKASCGGMIFGRNYDWQDCSVMIVHTKPENGYESVSTCCLTHIGIDQNWEPKNKFPADALALASIYVPMDGMNEKGLYIADLMAGDKEATAQNRGKTDIITTDAIRLILDKAANVDEALELINQYDMNSVIGWAHHFALADNSGKSVVVEWLDNQMYVTETKLLTNHYLTEHFDNTEAFIKETENSRIRFDKLEKTADEAGWSMSSKEVCAALESVHAGQYSEKALTVWSAVFEPNAKKITYCFRENYENPFVIEF